jgi:hypothetical protein
MEFLIPIIVVPSALLFILAIGPFRMPLTRWLNRRADGGDSPELREELADQAERLAETEHRLLELEERLDFTERLLSTGKGEGTEGL